MVEVCVTFLLFCAVSGIQSLSTGVDEQVDQILNGYEDLDSFIGGSHTKLVHDHERIVRAAEKALAGRKPHQSRVFVPRDKTLHKRDTTTNFPEDLQLHEKLAKADKDFAILEFMDRVQTSKEECTGTTTLAKFNLSLQTSFEKFQSQTQSVIRYANVLNSFFHNRDVHSIFYKKDFYFYYLKALLESDPSLFGATIAFDRGQFNSQDFAPNAYREKSNRVHILMKDLAEVTNSAYATAETTGFDWFWQQRAKDYSPLLYNHREACNSRSRTNRSTVMTTAKEGMWSAPYYSCSHGASWMVTYSAPFFGCVQQKGSDERSPHFK